VKAALKGHEPARQAAKPLFQRALVWHGSLYATLVLLHLAGASFMRYPRSFYDECTYLGFARYFAGVSHVPNLTGGASGHFGYALFLVPAFLVAQAFYHQYHAALAINAFLLSSSYFSLYFLLSKLADISRTAAMTIAFVTCLYPSFLIFSNIIATENAFIPVFLLIPVSLLILIEKQTLASSVFAGGAVGATYMVHSRGISVLLGATLLLVLLASMRRLSWLRVALALLIIAGAYLLTGRVNARLSDLGFSGHGLPSGGPALAQLQTGAGLHAFAMVFLGQLVYLLQATYCLYFAGWTYLFVKSRTGRDSADRTARFSVSALLLATGLAIAVGSAIFIAPQDPFHRANHLLIGRYNEGIGAVFIAFSLALVWVSVSDRDARRLLVKSVLAGAIVLTACTFAVSPYVIDLTVCSMNSLANMPMIWLSGGNNLTRATLITLLVSCVLALVYYFKRQWSIALVAVLFVAGALSIFRENYSQRLVPAGTHPAVLSARITSPLLKASTVSYDMAVWSAFYYASYQLLAPRLHFLQFNSERGESPTSPVVIASASWKDATRLGYKEVAREPGFDQALWIARSSEPETDKAVESFLNREVGSLFVSGVQTQGLYPVESGDVVRYRWTNGKARIRVPLKPEERVRRLLLELYAFGITPATISVNGLIVRRLNVGPGPTKATVLLAKPVSGNTLDIEILSPTFMPTPPTRELGVEVHSLKLLP
jgi:hypothetical protein